MQDLQVTLTTILAVFGGISVVGGGVTMILKLFSPAKKISVTVNEHTRLLDNDNKRLLELEGTNRLICRALLVLLEHEITGNSDEKLKQMKDEIQNFLIQK